MGKRVIFLSYSHADLEVCRALEKQLRPLLEQETDIELFLDERSIDAGDKWESRIEDALDRAIVAVLLISPDFLVSRYVREKEVPALAKAVEDGTCILLVSVVRPTAAYDKELVHCTPDGKDVRLTPAAFQALHPPDQPLSRLEPAQREAVIAESARKIRDAALSFRRASEAGLAARGRTVVVKVSPDGDRLKMEFAVEGAIAARDSVAQHPDASSMARLFSFVRAPSGVSISRAFAQLARQFAAEDASTLPSPSGLPLALLLQSAAPFHVEADWNSLILDGVDLVKSGWSVAVMHQDARATGRVDLSPSGRAMILVADPGHGLGLHAHCTSIKHRIEERSGGRAAAEIYHRLERVRDALRSERPALVYVCTCQDGDTGLHFEDKSLPFRDLPGLFDAHVPTVAVFSVCHVRDPRALARTIHEVAVRVPFVLLRTFDPAHPQGRTKELFLDGAHAVIDAILFERRSDDLVHDARTRSGPDTWVWSSSARFVIEPGHVQQRRRRLARLLLDRSDQRAIVAKHVQDDLLRKGRRVVAVVGHGEQHALVDAFARQAYEYLRDNTPGVAVRKFDFVLDESDQLDVELMELELAHRLGCDRENLAQGLRGLVREIGTTVVVVDFGTRGRRSESRISSQQLGTWREFLARVLTQTPSHVRILAVLAVETDKTQQLGKVIAELAVHNDERFALHGLPRIDIVPVPEILEYLREHGAFPVDVPSQALIIACAEWLFAHSAGGRFDRLVELIDRYQDNGWHELLELVAKRPQRNASPDASEAAPDDPL
ncbi:MAG: toll/interleukin-1 receptor domain-containing protein [Planctomycetota bacterium]